MNMSESKPRILVLMDDASAEHEAAKLLGKRYEIEQFADMDKALEALDGGTYEAVFAQTKDFLPLERALVKEKSNLVLNTIGEGVCLISPSGEYLWSNQKMQDFSDTAKE